MSVLNTLNKLSKVTDNNARVCEIEYQIFKIAGDTKRAAEARRILWAEAKAGNVLNAAQALARVKEF